MSTSLHCLPVEIRQKIYSLVLEEPEEIIIQVYNARQQAIHLGVARVGHHRNSKHRGQRYVRAKGWVPVVSSNAGLLRVSKQAHAEAAPLFYGHNKFLFMTANALERFLVQITGMKAHLRHIIIPTCAFMMRIRHSAPHSAIHRSLKSLVAAKDLRSLEISHAYFCPCSYYLDPTPNYERLVKQLFKHCKPLLASLKASYEAKNLLLDVLDVVNIVPLLNPWSYFPRYQCLCQNDGRKNDTITALFKEEISSQLNLPHE